jgi:hypothetical protein
MAHEVVKYVANMAGTRRQGGQHTGEETQGNNDDVIPNVQPDLTNADNALTIDNEEEPSENDNNAVMDESMVDKDGETREMDLGDKRIENTGATECTHTEDPDDAEVIEPEETAPSDITTTDKIQLKDSTLDDTVINEHTQDKQDMASGLHSDKVERSGVEVSANDLSEATTSQDGGSRGATIEGRQVGWYVMQNKKTQA